MRRLTVWKLLVMGGVSAVIGWLVWYSPTLVSFPERQAVSILRWTCFLGIPCIGGMVLALLFPVWNRLLKMRNSLVGSITFWLVVPVVALMALSILLQWISPAQYFGAMRFSRHLIFLLVGELVAGLCFYWMGRLLRYTHRDSAVR